MEETLSILVLYSHPGSCPAYMKLAVSVTYLVTQRMELDTCTGIPKMYTYIHTYI